jgi:hypothetical protein
MQARTLAEAMDRPAAGVVVLRGSPDGDENRHADSGPRGTEPEPARALDLLDGLLLGELLSNWIGVRWRVMDDV